MSESRYFVRKVGSGRLVAIERKGSGEPKVGEELTYESKPHRVIRVEEHGVGPSGEQNWIVYLEPGNVERLR